MNNDVKLKMNNIKNYQKIILKKIIMINKN